MSYIKINKDSLDYDYYARFHSYTMNNFVRNIMQNGKYKKALTIARSGLRRALIRIRKGLLEKHVGTAMVYNTREPTISCISNKTQNQMIETLNIYKNSNLLDDLRNENEKLPVYQTGFLQQLTKPRLKNKFRFEEAIDFHNIDDKVYSDGILDTDDLILSLDEQYSRLKEELEFKKIYTKRPRIYFLKNHKYTVFDLIIQAYTAAANVWAMRKIKVSGRTVLVPTPLRPLRRISLVTKMMMQGIRQLRKEDRWFKDAMIRSLADEIFYLVFYYHPVRPLGNITNSKVWQLKLKSQKELVANLKNIKHTIYI